VITLNANIKAESSTIICASYDIANASAERFAKINSKSLEISKKSQKIQQSRQIKQELVHNI
jgi:hypothetical protein